MKIEFELEDRDVPRVKMFINNIIEYEINHNSHHPDQHILRFLNGVDRAISQECLK